MPVAGTEATLGKAINDAVTAIGIDASAPITPAQLESIWVAVAKEIIDHFTANTLVSTTVTGATGAGPPGGPLPIAGVPGTGSIS